MEGLGDFLIKSHLETYGERRYSEQREGIKISEIYQHENSAKLETRKIANAEVIPWLDQNLVVGDGSNKSEGTMRIVWLTLKTDTHPWQSNIEKGIHFFMIERFDLKRAYQLAPKGGGVTCLPADYRSHSGKQSFALNTIWGDLDIMWTYDLMTYCTKVIWMSDSRNKYPTAFARIAIEYQKRLVKHPMFMAFVTAIYLQHEIEGWIQNYYRDIVRVEQRTRHSPPTSPTYKVAEGSYASLSAAMSGTSTSIAGLEVDNAIVRELLNSLLEYRWPQGVEQPDWAQKVIKKVNECVVILAQRNEAQKRLLHYLSRRADIQLTAVGHKPHCSIA